MLAHGALAALIVDNMPPISSPVFAAAAALAEQDVAIGHYVTAADICSRHFSADGARIADLKKQAGDAQMLGLCNAVLPLLR